MAIQHSLTDKINLSKIEADNQSLTDVYGESFQSNLLKCFVTDFKFYLKYAQFLQVDTFSKFHGFLFDEFNKYHSKYSSLPSRDVVEASLIKQKISDDSKEFLDEILNVVYDNQNMGSLDYYKNEAKNFIRDRRVRDAFVKTIELANKGKYQAVAEEIIQAVKDVDVESSIGLDFLNSDKMIGQSYELDIIPTPFNALNGILKGGLAKGELGLIMGGTGAGKSWVLQTIAAHSFLNNQNVVYYTLEMSEVAVAKRIAGIILEKNSEEVTEADILTIKQMAKDKGLTSRLYIVEYPTKSASIETLKNNLKNLYNQLNFKADLICVDYADLLKATERYTEKRFELSGIYEGLRGWAGEEHSAMWTISQVNRSGFNKKVITVENIAEDYGKATICDFILSVGRTIEDRVGGMAKAFVAKNRRGRDALEFGMDMLFDKSKITMHDEYVEVKDATKYKEKTEITDESLDNLLEQLG